MRKLFDSDVIESIALFIIAGLNPGSFGTACMALDKDRAYQCAHRALLLDAPNSDGQDIVSHMLEYCEEHMPSNLRGDYDALTAWAEQGGLLQADESTKLMMRLQGGNNAWYLAKINPRFRAWVQGIPDAPVPAHNAMIWMTRLL
jgi:hypothetical protein